MNINFESCLIDAQLSIGNDPKKHLKIQYDPSDESYDSTLQHPDRDQFITSNITTQLAASSQRNEDGSYVCNLCPYTTSQFGHLKRHMKTHTGEKPFGCPFCSYRGTQKHHVERHMIKHTREMPFACELCPFKAMLKSSLDRHFLSNHVTV